MGLSIPTDEHEFRLAHYSNPAKLLSIGVFCSKTNWHRVFLVVLSRPGLAVVERVQLDSAIDRN
jgi:hypothetical protein